MNGDFFDFEVSDNGAGIESQYYDKIFTIFQTLQAKDILESTGIGLTRVKKSWKTKAAQFDCILRWVRTQHLALAGQKKIPAKINQPKI